MPDASFLDEADDGGDEEVIPSSIPRRSSRPPLCQSATTMNKGKRIATGSQTSTHSGPL